MNKQREMFEAWYSDNYSAYALKSWNVNDECYSNLDTELAWMAWQAAVAAQENNKLSWQPIKTAPKDDTRIIIFSERRGAREARFYRENEEGAEWFDVIVGGGPMTHFYDATHWMPLPQEPNK